VPAESETDAPAIHAPSYIGLPGKFTGAPNIKVIPQWSSKYQLSNSCWEKPIREIRRNKPEMMNRFIWEISSMNGQPTKISFFPGKSNHGWIVQDSIYQNAIPEKQGKLSRIGV
jgi:hypothetical protein